MSRTLVTCLLIFLSIPVFAAEEKAEGQKEEKGGAEGEKKQGDPEWLELTNSIAMLEGRISQKRENLVHLIEEKRKLPENSPELKDVLAEMLKENRELQKSEEEWNKKIVILRFRYPERGLKGERHYEKLELKSLEQVERELGIEGRLNRNQDKLRRQYRAGEKRPSKEAASDSSALKGHTTEQTEKPIDETKTYLIEK